MKAMERTELVIQALKPYIYWVPGFLNVVYKW